MAIERTLQEVLNAASVGRNPSGWIYFRSSDPLAAETLCLLVEHDEGDEDAGAVPGVARRAGFPVEGLDTETIEDCVRWAQQLVPDTPQELLVESFSYYWRFDAFLPFPGAPDPPPPDVSKLRSDRKFYDELGAERRGVPCRTSGCNRGAVALSIYCRIHHFESILGTPCPFSH